MSCLPKWPSFPCFLVPILPPRSCLHMISHETISEGHFDVFFFWLGRLTRDWFLSYFFIKVYQTELEKVEGFSGFEDFINLFPLYRGKAKSREEEEDAVVGEFKVWPWFFAISWLFILLLGSQDMILIIVVVFIIIIIIIINSPVTKPVEAYARHATAKHACTVWRDRTAIFKVKSSCLSRHHCFLSSQTVLVCFAIALWVHLRPLLYSFCHQRIREK